MVLEKTQWEEMGMAEVNTDLSFWRRQLGKSLFTNRTRSKGDEAKLAGDKL